MSAGIIPGLLQEFSRYFSWVSFRNSCWYFWMIFPGISTGTFNNFWRNFFNKSTPLTYPWISVGILLGILPDIPLRTQSGFAAGIFFRNSIGKLSRDFFTNLYGHHQLFLQEILMYPGISLDFPQQFFLGFLLVSIQEKKFVISLGFFLVFSFEVPAEFLLGKSLWILLEFMPEFLKPFFLGFLHILH